MGYPPGQIRMGYPLPCQDSRASTCYAVGGMPLALIQEDCLVGIWIHIPTFSKNEEMSPVNSLLEMGEKKFISGQCVFVMVICFGELGN